MVYNCAPGNYLDENNDCTPFLPYPPNLGYTLALGINVFINIKNDSYRIVDVMEPLLMAVTHNLLNCNELCVKYAFVFTITYFTCYDVCREYVDSAQMVVMNNCDTIIPSNVTFQVSIKLRLSFLFRTESIDRRKFEESLINIIFNAQSIVTNFKDFLEFTAHVSADIESFFLPMNVDRLRLDPSSCFLAVQEHKLNNIAYRHVPLSKTLRCPQIVLNKDRYIFDYAKQSVTIIPKGPLLKFGEFRMDSKDRIAVCVEDFKRIENIDTKSTLETILGIVTVSCVCLSMFCIFLAFLTYLLFPVLRTVPGNNNMCLLVALFLSQGFTQFGLGETTLHLTCTIVGVCIHYFWLATFFCMNVCSYHVFKVFVKPFHSVLETQEQRMQEQRMLLFRYISYSYGVPAVIIIIHITLSLPLSGSIGYGNGVICFIDTPQAIVATFLTPISLLCVLNVVLFSIAAYAIKTSPKVPSTNSLKVEFSTYLKLFVLTGFTWIAQIIESFLPLSAFSVVVAVLNGSSGLFIFLSYSMNERVRTFYKNRFAVSTDN